MTGRGISATLAAFDQPVAMNKPAGRGSTTMSAKLARVGFVFGSLLSTLLLGGCVVWQSDYDALKTQNDQLQQQVAAQSSEISADKAQIARLQGAIKLHP